MPTQIDQPAPSPITSFLRHWPLAVVLALVFAALGVVAGSLLPSSTTAQARLAVGPGDMSAGAIAGFPEATKSMAEDYSRWVTSNSVQQGGPQVSASPVPESNVIQIEATAKDDQSAVQAAQSAADALVKQVNEGRDSTDPNATLGQVQQTSQQWSAAATELERAKWEFDQVNHDKTSSDSEYNSAAAVLTKAQSQEAYLKAQLDAQTDKYKNQVGEASQAADLRMIQQAQVSSNTANSLRQRYGILGAAVGLLLALVIATMRDRRRARRAGREA